LPTDAKSVRIVELPDRPTALNRRIAQGGGEAARERLPAKGVFAAAEAPGCRGVLQVVGKRVDVAFDGEWGQRPPRTRIVAIGAAGTIGPGDLETHFAACLVEGDGAAERSLQC
jgi:G3E family GTPase